MSTMETLGKIRRWHNRDGESIRKIAKKTSLSRNTVRKYLREETAEPNYRERRVATKLDRFSAQLRQWLEGGASCRANSGALGVRLCEDLQALGYAGGYGRVVAFIRSLKQEAATGRRVHTAQVCAWGSIPVRLERGTGGCLAARCRRSRRRTSA